MPDNFADRLASLTLALQHAQLDGFIQPVNDEFQGEYTPDYAKRLEWISGFTGSAGAGLFLAHPIKNKQAILFVDGRYTLQAAQQVDTQQYTIINSMDAPLPQWLAAHLGASDMRIGYDPWLHTEAQIRHWHQLVDKTSIKLIPLNKNPIDGIWNDQPTPPLGAVTAHPLTYAGESIESKCAKIVQTLADQHADAVLLALPDGINWLLNIRGDDIPYNPLLLSFALVDKSGGIRLITYERPFNWNAHYNKINICNFNDLSYNCNVIFQNYSRVMMDPHTTASWFFAHAREMGLDIIEHKDPTLMLKAIKNPVEMEGMRNAHARDGKALSHLLEWLQSETILRDVTELEVMDKLEQMRAQTGNLYRGPSFATIAGAGEHGAIVHYHATQSSNRILGQGELFLLDSGGQYLDGTTDVTRTIAIGAPSGEMRERFTQVLKGHIAIATAIFPQGTSGSQLDALARQYLWEAACDYDHGTGHGVGSFLCVHEGPQRISKRGGDTPLQAGMVLSNEPGYYKTGEYGIRIENLVLVVEGPTGEDGRQFLQFETLTLAPLDESLIDHSLLTPKETQWLHEYQARVAANNRSA